jgi:hypothetical protein
VNIGVIRYSTNLKSIVEKFEESLLDICPLIKPGKINKNKYEI